MTEERANYTIVRYDKREIVETQARKIAEDPQTSPWLVKAIKELLGGDD